MTEINQESFPIMSYLKIFFRRKELLIIPAFLGLIVGICAGYVLPKKYRSSTVILVEEGKSDNPLFNNLAVSTTIRERLATIQESMLGLTSLETLIQRLKLAKDVKTEKDYESLVKKLQADIEIHLKGNNVLNISYVSDDPIRTQAVVKNITDIFIERNKDIQNRETSEAIIFIEEQLKVYKGKIKSAEIARFQDQLDSLLIDSTDKHPLVKQLREQIAKKKEALEKEKLQYTEPEKLKVETTNPLIDTITGALDNLNRDPLKNKKNINENPEETLAKVMLLDKIGNVVAARDAQVNESIYNSLLQRLETAKITQRLQESKEGTRYTMTEPPRIPLAPFQPNRLLVALAGLFFGGVLGFGLVVATEFMDKSFLDVEDTKEFLGMPLLGAISKINTEETIRQEHERQRWLYSLTFISGLALIVMTVALTKYLH